MGRAWRWLRESGGGALRRLPPDHPARRTARAARTGTGRAGATARLLGLRAVRRADALRGAPAVRSAAARAARLRPLLGRAVPAGLRPLPGRARRAAARLAADPSRITGRASRAARGYAAAPIRTVATAATGAGLALALLAVLAAGPWRGGQRTAERAFAAGAARRAGAAGPPRPLLPVPRWHPAAQVLAPAGPGAGTGAGKDAYGTGTAARVSAGPSRSGLAAVLGPLLARAGGGLTAAVADPATGRILYSSGGDRPQPPASTNKLLTATAALTLLGPEHRISTTAVLSGGRVVLVGGGDPTLTTAHNPAGAGLADLADRTAAALRAAGTTTVGLGYDLSLFTGPALHPIGVNDNIALVQPLLADEGRIDPHSTEAAPRYADPAAEAAESFARLLRARGITVRGAVRPTTAAAGAPVLAAVRSAPLADIIERMLTVSDNDVAESLDRLVAVAAGQPASFAGGVAAVRRTLAGLGVDLAGVTLHDGSGLDAADAIPADVLAQVLALDASPAHPELRAVLSGLPVAGFTGTLDDRFDGIGGAGLVHAKTGSLTGVDTLAGTVVDRGGRLLVFAFMSHGGGPLGSQRGLLDVLAARLAGCGCG